MNVLGSISQPLSYRRAMLLIGIVLAMHSRLGLLPAQEPKKAPSDLSRTMDQALANQIGQYDWEAEVPLLQKAVENIWRQNKWNDESDRYALDLIGEVAKIPPWKPLERIDLMSIRIAERYDIPDAGALRIKTRIMIELGQFLSSNAELLMENVREGMDARISGKPFTAEQVARWMETSMQFRDDTDAATERLISDIESMVGPGGRAQLEKDLAAYAKRMEHFDRMTELWRKGDWQPTDWGMQDDPVQNEHHPGLRKGAGQNKDAPPKSTEWPTKWIAHDQSTWIAYVLDFKRRFGLDPGQVATAESIHAEMVRRADVYAKSRLDALRKIPVAQRADSPSYLPIVDLFGELRERLDAIPTRGQREAAEP